MSTFINGGVVGATTKTALKAAVKADPSKVRFVNTSPMGDQFRGPVSDMPDGATLVIAGPDPYRDRRWFANIKRNGDKITVS